MALFSFNDSQIRVVTIEDQPWFVAKDVLLALDLHVYKNGQTNTTVSLGKLNETERTFYRLETSPGTFKPYSRMAIISESGLYKLVMRSDKPQARSFQD